MVAVSASIRLANSRCSRIPVNSHRITVIFLKAPETAYNSPTIAQLQQLQACYPTKPPILPSTIFDITTPLDE